MFLNETLIERLLFHSETVTIKVCNLFRVGYFSDIRPDQIRTASAFATALCG